MTNVILDAAKKQEVLNDANYSRVKVPDDLARKGVEHILFSERDNEYIIIWIDKQNLSSIEYMTHVSVTKGTFDQFAEQMPDILYD